MICSDKQARSRTDLVKICVHCHDEFTNASLHRINILSVRSDHACVVARDPPYCHSARNCARLSGLSREIVRKLSERVQESSFWVFRPFSLQHRWGSRTALWLVTCPVGGRPYVPEEVDCQCVHTVAECRTRGGVWPKSQIQ